MNFWLAKLLVHLIWVSDMNILSLLRPYLRYDNLQWLHDCGAGFYNQIDVSCDTV